MVSVDVQIGVSMGMRKALDLLLIFLLGPVELFARHCNGVRDFEKNQDIGVCDTLPHIGSKGVFLGNLAHAETARAQPTGQFRLSRSACSYDSNACIFCVHICAGGKSSGRRCRDTIFVAVCALDLARCLVVRG